MRTFIRSFHDRKMSVRRTLTGASPRDKLAVRGIGLLSSFYIIRRTFTTLEHTAHAVKKLFNPKRNRFARLYAFATSARAVLFECFQTGHRITKVVVFIGRWSNISGDVCNGVLSNATLRNVLETSSECFAHMRAYDSCV